MEKLGDSGAEVVRSLGVTVSLELRNLRKFLNVLWNLCPLLLRNGTSPYSTSSGKVSGPATAVESPENHVGMFNYLVPLI